MAFLTNFQLILGYVRDVFLLQHSSTLAWTMHWGGCRKILGNVVSFGTVRFTDLDFTNDAVIFAETTDVIAEALEFLSGRATVLDQDQAQGILWHTGCGH